jgi:hypothetical protein
MYSPTIHVTLNLWSSKCKNVQPSLNKIIRKFTIFETLYFSQEITVSSNEVVIRARARQLNQTLRSQEINQAELLMNKDLTYVWIDYPSVFGESDQVFRSSVTAFQFNAAYPRLYFYELAKS